MKQKLLFFLLIVVAKIGPLNAQSVSVSSSNTGNLATYTFSYTTATNIGKGTTTPYLFSMHTTSISGPTSYPPLTSIMPLTASNLTVKLNGTVTPLSIFGNVFSTTSMIGLFVNSASSTGTTISAGTAVQVIISGIITNPNTPGNYTLNWKTATSGNVTVTSYSAPLTIVCASSNTTINQSICQGSSYLFNGISRTTSGNYLDTFSNATGCDSIITLNLSVNPFQTPVFSFAGNVCSGTTLFPLSSTSNNGISGAWSPVWDNLNAATYTFTPNPGVCANTITQAINITSPTVPTFTPVNTICQGTSLSNLPTVSNNGVTGSWSPALNNIATTTYTFTPIASECATATTMTITVNPLPFNGISTVPATSNVNVSTLAGSTQGYLDGVGTGAMFNFPTGMIKDMAGNILICDNYNHKIRKIDMNGVVSTYTGSTQGYQDGSLANAKFSQPGYMAIDDTGNIYITDWLNYKIRKINTSGQVSTFAGTSPGSAEGTTTTAQFTSLMGIAIDAVGNIYVADYHNHRIRKISNTGQVTTLAGGIQGYADGNGSSAQFSFPTGMCIDRSGNLYVGDNSKIRKITPSGDVTTFAGSANYGFADGQGSSAMFRGTDGLFMEPSGCILVSDEHRIRKITPGGYVSTVAGLPIISGNTNGNGLVAKFNHTWGILSDSTGTIYAADQGNHRIRKIIQTNLSISPCNGSALTLSGVGGDSYTWSGPQTISNGISFNAVTSGVYTVTASNALACASTNTITVQVSPNYTITATPTLNGSISPSGASVLCQGNNQTYTITPSANYGISNVNIDGVNVGTSGTYTFTNVTANHNIEATFYLVCSNSFNNITQEICQGSGYTFFGNTITVTGIYTHTIVNGNATGCDSIVTLNLTVQMNSTSTTNLSICSHELPYSWNGLTFTLAGTQTAHLTNSVGCDSAATLNLSVSPSTTFGASSVTACISYTWNGNTYTNSGTFYHSLGACDVTVLNLTITSEIVLQAKALLQGAYDPNTGMMHDSLRTKDLIPTLEPYTASPYLKPAILEFSGELENTPQITTGSDAIVDWVFLELRDATDPSSIKSTRRALIQRDGDIVSHEDGVSPVRFYQTPPGTYFVGLKHRNHLGLMSAGTFTFPYCTPVIVDFTNPATPVYVKTSITTNPPRNMMGSVALLWAGDANYNKNVKNNGISNDKTTVLNAVGGVAMINNVLNNVYRMEDCNLNGKINYNGTDNDRSVVLTTVGVSTPNNVVNQHTID